MGFRNRVLIFMFSQNEGAKAFQKMLEEKATLPENDSGYNAIEKRLARASLALVESIYPINRHVFVLQCERAGQTSILENATACLQEDLEKVASGYNGTMLIVDLDTAFNGGMNIEKREFMEKGATKITTKIHPRGNRTTAHS